MAAATYSVTTSSSDLDELWRKVQMGVLEAYQFGVEEWNYFLKLKNKDVRWSAREITAELDFTDDINVASIPEGGKEARPASPTAVTATFTWILLNARFTVSLTAEYIQRQQGTRPQLVSQFKWQTKKKVQAVRRRVGDMLYGYSTGVIGHLTENNTGTKSLDLDNLYGVTSLGGTTAELRVVDLCRENEFYAIMQSDGTFREIVQASSIARATNIITTAANMSTTADGDLLVDASSVENTSAAGTAYNRALVGLLDMINSTSVHGVSSATSSRWAAALNNSDGGRFTGIKLRKAKQQINNKGGGKADTVLWSQGVENDVTAQLQAGLRFSDSWGMEMDGSPKSKGITFMSTKRVPDGYAFIFDRKQSIKKGTLLPEPKPGALAWGDGQKLQDDSGKIYSIDYPCFLMTGNRANMACYSSLAEQ
jgi:hypothetical protein